MILWRSLLFTPGNNMRMIAKAGTLAADAVILDLEDSVPVSDKETARLFVRDSLVDVGRGDAAVLVRINAPDTGLSEDDLDWVVQPGLHGIVLPKAESAEDVVNLANRLERLESDRKLADKSLAIVPILESAKGVMNGYPIATASSRVAALAFGGVDFSRDMAVDLTPEGMELFYPRAQIAIAARAAGVLAVDTPCTAINDPVQLKAEAKAVRQLGFRGKLLIHPAHVRIVNEVFSPTTAEVNRARKIVEAFGAAQEQGLGAISLDGKMIDVANFRQAQDLLAWAEAVGLDPQENQGSRIDRQR
jgi:citrate lyase subunit beta/citryl-CoA lyase